MLPALKLADGHAIFCPEKRDFASIGYKMVLKKQYADDNGK